MHIGVEQQGARALAALPYLSLQCRASGLVQVKGLGRWCCKQSKRWADEVRRAHVLCVQQGLGAESGAVASGASILDFLTPTSQSDRGCYQPQNRSTGRTQFSITFKRS